MLRTAYRWWVAILFLGVIVQIGLAGYGAFYAVDKADDAGKNTIVGDKVTHGFGPHSGLGYVLFLGSILLFLLALGSRFERRRVLWNLAIPLLFIVQIVLAWIGGGVAGLGFLHPINALVIFSVLGATAHRAWREGSVGPGAPGPANGSPAPA